MGKFRKEPPVAKKAKPAVNPLSIPKSYLQQSTKSKKSAREAQVIVFGIEDRNSLAQLLNEKAPSWRMQSGTFLERELFFLESDEAPVWLLVRKRPKGPFSHEGRLEETDYAWYRDQGGAILQQAKAAGVVSLEIEFRATESEAERGFMVGMEMAAYSYKNLILGKEFDDYPSAIQFRKSGGEWDRKRIEEAAIEGQSINLARHLVNLPPNFLNPTTFASFVKGAFPKSGPMKLEIWDEKRLRSEGMGLILGVGAGSPNPPCLVRLKYRPSKAGKARPLAFVGKGITFDTGGLDIKPSSGMRLMKKDMGGAASIAALAWYALNAKVPRAMDFYLALAENSVDGRSMRPSDVLQARNGMRVEIHNTDAEGRLVLADALDVAVTQKGVDEPESVVNVATLTGAIKVALGAEIAGLFSNHDDLADSLEQSGREAGDLSWRMPLYSRYTAGFSTPFGDLVNATDGFGGAITAALFLEKFVRQKPWAHLDVYAWNDKPTGALGFTGGSGQPVGCLIQFLKSQAAGR